jgi:predicted RNase H-like HicB family nuclease
MEQIINIHVERQPEGVYLATSEDVPGLVAQGRTVTETMEIARDVARKILEAQAERRENPTLSVIGDSFDCALVSRRTTSCGRNKCGGFGYRNSTELSLCLRGQFSLIIHPLTVSGIVIRKNDADLFAAATVHSPISFFSRSNSSCEISPRA